MTTLKKLLLLATVVSVTGFSASAQAGQTLTVANASQDYVTDAQKIVKKTDWNQMETVTVIFGERGEDYLYQPSNLTFKAGQPYKLVLKNKGKKKHYFTAPEFFKAVASRKVQSNQDGEIKAPYFLALEVMAKGGQLDLYFVPVRAGTYPVYCTIDDHQKRGMEGQIVIE